MGDIWDFITDEFINKFLSIDHELEISKDVYLGGGCVIRIGDIDTCMSQFGGQIVREKMVTQRAIPNVELHWENLKSLQFNSDHVMSIFGDPRIEKIIFHGTMFNLEAYSLIIFRETCNETIYIIRDVTYIVCYMKLDANLIKGG
jgi:hypothetical protein